MSFQERSQQQSPISGTVRQPSSGLDRVGTVASGACVVHCTVCAVAPGVFAALGISWLSGHRTEWAFTLIAVTVALAALTSAWRSHRSHIALSFLSLGAVGLMLSRGMEEGGSHALGAGTGLISGLALLSGHLVNLRKARTCRAVCSAMCGHSQNN